MLPKLSREGALENRLELQAECNSSSSTEELHASNCINVY